MCVAHGPGGRGGPYPGRFEYSAFADDLEVAGARDLADVISMSAEEMARASRLVMGAYHELLQTASSLENENYRELMAECTARPRVTFLEMYKTDADRRRLFDEMVKLGFFNPADDPD